jgi:hypothetical protein
LDHGQKGYHFYRFCGAWWPAGAEEKCENVGPRSITPEGANQKATEAGWQWIEGKLVCPAHAREYYRLLESGKKPTNRI